MTLLWRDAWLKPLSDFDVGAERCAHCKKAFRKIEFVTACDFCLKGIMHDLCANRHILFYHKRQLEDKINSQKDKPLHDFQ